MLSDDYFNGARLSRYLMLRNIYLGKEDKEGESLLRKYIPRAQNMYDDYVKRGMYMSQIFKNAYDEFIKNQDLMLFEETVLGIKFFLSKEEYNKMLHSDIFDSRYMYSTIAYERISKDMVRFRVYDVQVDVHMSSVLSVISPLTYSQQQTIRSVGVVQEAVRVPFRETISAGQMKIGVDLVRLMQLLDRTDRIHVLVVGSASEAAGGSRSYPLLDSMFTNSIFSLYDPYESNVEYKTDRGNVYKRYAEKFVYDKLDKYDVVQDDAFVSFHSNRMRIDPGMILSSARVFSAKMLQGDEAYFTAIGKIRRKEVVVIRQVGKTETLERRAMSGVNLKVKKQDDRFGNCPFCLEMQSFVKFRYEDKFFETWARCHDVNIRCELKRRFVVPNSIGVVDYKGRMMNIVTQVDNGVSMVYDPVDDYPLTNNFDPLEKRVYVFSAVENIFAYMFSAKVAVRVSTARGVVFYVNYEPDIAAQEKVQQSFNFLGFKFVRMKLQEKKILRILLPTLWFKEYGDVVVPEERLDKSLGVSLLSYYGRFFVNTIDQLYCTTPLI